LAGIKRETVRQILVEGLKKKTAGARSGPRPLTPYQKHQQAASSVEKSDDRNVFDSNGRWKMVFDERSGNQTSECILVQSKET
jgi:hypothetical protein